MKDISETVMKGSPILPILNHKNLRMWFAKAKFPMVGNVGKISWQRQKFTHLVEGEKKRRNANV